MCCNDLKSSPDKSPDKKNIMCCGNSLEIYHGDASNEYHNIHSPLSCCSQQPFLCKQCRPRSEEAIWSGSTLFVIRFVNLNKTLYDVIWLDDTQKWVWLINCLLRNCQYLLRKLLVLFSGKKWLTCSYTVCAFAYSANYSVEAVLYFVVY